MAIIGLILNDAIIIHFDFNGLTSPLRLSYKDVHYTE